RGGGSGDATARRRRRRAGTARSKRAGMAMEGFADLRDAQRAERTDVQRERPGRQADAGAAGSDPLDHGRVRPRIRRAEADGAGERAEAVVDSDRLRPSVQRERSRIRSTVAGVDRMGEAEPAARVAGPAEAGHYDGVDWIRRVLPAVLALVLFIAALEVLRRELHSVTWHALSARALGTPPWLIATAFLLTALNYLVLSGYDFIAVASIGRRLPLARVAVTSFLAYAIANSVGFAMLSGASVRYRFYSRWGITGQQFSRIVISYSVTFWLGLLALGGLSLVFSPLLADVAFPRTITTVGLTLLSISVAYVVAA